MFCIKYSETLRIDKKSFSMWKNIGYKILLMEDLVNIYMATVQSFTSMFN